MKKDQNKIPTFRKGFINAYRAAGPGFLAYRLERVFCRIENEEDRILHNDIINEIDWMLLENKNDFIRYLAKNMLLKKQKKPFLRSVSNWILHKSFVKVGES